MSIGSNMRMWREERGLSLKEVEIQTGINNGNLSRYERDLNYPSIESCIKLADLYDISVDELIGRNDGLTSSVHQSKDSFHVSPEERKLIEDYRGLGSPLKTLLRNIIQSMQDGSQTNTFQSKK